MGILYSRSIGVLFSNGNYIFPLVSDDMLLSSDIFNTIYNEIKDDDIDIIKFKSISIWNLHDFFIQKNLKGIGNYKNIIYERQPKLGESAINKYIIWGKSIKTKIFKKAIKAINKKRYSQYMTFIEDAITFYIICQFSEVSKSILKYAILKINYSNSAMHSRNDVKVNIYKLKYIEIIMEFSRNSFKAKEGVVGIILELLKKKNLIKSLNNKKIKKYFCSLIEKILFSSYISKENKNRIKNLYYLIKVKLYKLKNLKINSKDKKINCLIVLFSKIVLLKVCYFEN